jgi:hypothetical protein
MKRKSHRFALSVVLMLASLASGAAGQQARISLKVKAGDTFTNLFGADWEKAYRQNRVILFRNGKPVSSPDLLIEGTIVRVSSDVGLTPRAVARCGELRARRDDLAGRVKALAETVAGDEAAARVLDQVRQVLRDDLTFAANVELATRQLQQLETLTTERRAFQVQQAKVRDEASNWHSNAVVTLLLAGVVVLLSVFAVWRRRTRPAFPEADARYREVLADLESSFRSVGEEI